MLLSLFFALVEIQTVSDMQFKIENSGSGGVRARKKGNFLSTFCLVCDWGPLFFRFHWLRKSNTLSALSFFQLHSSNWENVSIDVLFGMTMKQNNQFLFWQIHQTNKFLRKMPRCGIDCMHWSIYSFCTLMQSSIDVRPLSGLSVNGKRSNENNNNSPDH